MTKRKGEIVWFDNKLGFGFVKNADGVLNYLHYKDIRTEGHRYFRKGDKVVFDEYRAEDGFRLTDAHSDISHRRAWRYASNRGLRRFLYWLTKRKSVRYMWCIRSGVRYVSLIRYYLFASRVIEIYIHQFLDDDERIWHDHPWRFVSFCIAGEYYDDFPRALQRKRVRRGQLIFRGNKYVHRNVLDETYKGKTFTLVITAGRKRHWFYYDQAERKLSTTEYGKLRGMEVKVYTPGLLHGMLFPRWELADFIPETLPAKKEQP